MDEKNREKEEYYQNLNELTEEYDKELEDAKACIEPCPYGHRISC